jgi:hypothetical protein
MTKGNGAVRAISDSRATGTPVSVTETGHGTAKLRDREAKGLIGLAADALSEAHSVAHELHSRIYDPDHKVPREHVEALLGEALICVQTTDHYLRMLSDVLAEAAL